MRQTMLAFLVTVVLLSGVTFAAIDEEALALEAEKIEFTLATRAKELDIEAHEAKLDFERQIQEMELEERRTELDQRHRGSSYHGRKHGGITCLIVLGMIIGRILSTIWVCKDLSQRRTGSGLWIPIVLLGGLFGLGVYALTRIGDIMQQPHTETA